jgi:hypothetical protein
MRKTFLQIYNTINKVHFFLDKLIYTIKIAILNFLFSIFMSLDKIKSVKCTDVPVEAGLKGSKALKTIRHIAGPIALSALVTTGVVGCGSVPEKGASADADDSSLPCDPEKAGCTPKAGAYEYENPDGTRSLVGYAPPEGQGPSSAASTPLQAPEMRVDKKTEPGKPKMRGTQFEYNLGGGHRYVETVSTVADPLDRIHVTRGFLIQYGFTVDELDKFGNPVSVTAKPGNVLALPGGTQVTPGYLSQLLASANINFGVYAEAQIGPQPEGGDMYIQGSSAGAYSWSESGAGAYIKSKK